METEAAQLLKVGDYIEFDHFGLTQKGIIETVGKYGYWISSGSVNGHGSIRCDFDKAKLIPLTPSPEDKQ